MNAISDVNRPDVRKENDSLGEVDVPADKLWGGPLIIFNITHSITIITDGCVNFRKFLVEGTKPNLKEIDEYVKRSLMMVMLKPYVAALNNQTEE
jgi:fumarate hydratase class II